jgi:hypothetical protein
MTGRRREATAAGARRVQTPLAPGIVETFTYWPHRALLALFGPATQDPDHDPIVALKRAHGRRLQDWEWPMNARREERQRTVETIRAAPQADLARLWRAVERQWGDEASRIWQEAFSAEDASDT